QDLDIVEEVHFRIAEEVRPVAVRRLDPRVVASQAKPGFGGLWIESEWIGHQKNLSRTTIVSPGWTRSVSFTLISFLPPLTMRMIAMRFSDPRSVTPPASDSACNTVVLCCCKP